MLYFPKNKKKEIHKLNEVDNGLSKGSSGWKARASGSLYSWYQSRVAKVDKECGGRHWVLVPRGQRDDLTTDFH